VLISWLECAPRDDVHPDAKEFLEVLEQADVIKKRRTGLEVHEQIQVTVPTSLVPGDGTEDGDPMNLALTRDAKDLRAALAKPLQRQHVSGHPRRVSSGTLAYMDQRRCIGSALSVRFSGGFAVPRRSIARR
jgi:hypothetical protein